MKVNDMIEERGGGCRKHPPQIGGRSIRMASAGGKPLSVDSLRPEPDGPGGALEGATSYTA